MRNIILSLASVLLAITAFREASAVPSFSRQASMTCKACHSQHVPILNGFGQAFKAGGYPMMGTQGKIEGENLSIPDTLNASMLLKSRYQKSNGANTDVISGDSTNSGQWQVPDEFSLYFGGRITENAGFFFEGNASGRQLVAAFKFPAAIYIADAKFSVIPYMTDIQGASYGFELSSTGAARNVSWAEHHREISAQQYIGTDTAATGVAIVAQNDTGYINLSRWAPAFMARKGAAQTLRSTYLRVAATPTLSTAKGDWTVQIGAQVWRGSNYAYDSLSPATYLYTPTPPTGGVITQIGGGPGLVTVETRATAFDFQASGQIGGKDLGIYATWAKSPPGTAAQPNILNVGTGPSGPEPTLYRLNDRYAWTIGAEYSLIQSTLHIGAAFRRANTGGGTGASAIAGTNPTDDAITLTFVYNITQNIAFHANHSIYSGSLYTTPQPMGNMMTTLMLEASW